MSFSSLTAPLSRLRRPLFSLAVVLPILCVLSPSQAMSRHEHHKLSLAHHEAQVAVSKLNSVRQHTAFASHNVVLAAYMLRGTRYVMGGTSRSGFDCSGFVRYILGHAGGVSLPRTAVDQFYHGDQVSLANLEPGDLVFFKNTYKHGISHVGIYAGSGKFIHAANPSRGVQMDSLDSSYYRAHYAGARRVLPAQLRALAALP